MAQLVAVEGRSIVLGGADIVEWVTCAGHQALCAFLRQSEGCFSSKLGDSPPSIA